MPDRPALLARRTLALALVAAAGAGGLSACGTDERTAYADGWDAVCRDVGGALSTFRTAVSSAATDSPDAGDAAVVGGTAAAGVTADLRRPAAALAEDLAAVRDDVDALDPPEEWAAWHAAEVRRLAVRLRTVDAGVARLGRGDAGATVLLAIGSVGPSAVEAPATLRDRTPECTTLR
jgi:hypothetical protein